MSILPKKGRRNFTGNFRSGYTLIEILIVLAIVTLMASAAFANMNSSQKYFTFSTSYEKVLQMVREARSLAVTGKTQVDYTDYDQDLNWGDKMTPAGYGVNFNTTTGVVTMFADLHKSVFDPNQLEGVYSEPTTLVIGQHLSPQDNGKDLILATYTINSTLKLVLAGGPTTIIYTPIFADVKFNTSLSPGPLFIFGVSEQATGGRKKCSQIHPVAGIPEVAPDASCPSS